MRIWHVLFYCLFISCYLQADKTPFAFSTSEQERCTASFCKPFQMILKQWSFSWRLLNRGKGSFSYREVREREIGAPFFVYYLDQCKVWLWMEYWFLNWICYLIFLIWECGILFETEIDYHGFWNSDISLKYESRTFFGSIRLRKCDIFIRYWINIPQGTYCLLPSFDLFIHIRLT